MLAELAKGQQPVRDDPRLQRSRVPPELVFDAGFGELFIVRVAGNVISAEIMGTLQYAGAHLHTPLFVVLGHEGCGAVKAALAAKSTAPRIDASSSCSRTSCPALAGRATDAAAGRALPCGVEPTCAGRCAGARDTGSAGNARGRRHEARRRRLRAETGRVRSFLFLIPLIPSRLTSASASRRSDRR